MNQVLIVGGGLGGVAAGVALARAGVNVSIYEQADQLREIGAGLSLWPNATRVLESWKLLEAARKRSGEIRRLEVRNPDGRLLSSVNTPGQLATPSLCIHRADLLQLLVEQFPPSQLHLGKRFVSLEERRDRVVATFADGTRAEGQTLIGADGLFSNVRQRLFGPTHPTYRGCHAWRGLADFRHGLGTTAIEFWGTGRRVGLEPLGPTRVFWYATENAAESDFGEPSSWKARLHALFDGWDARVLDSLDSTPLSALVCHDLYDRPTLSGFGRNRVTLLGDAAHPTTPHLGQGACMALEDAHVLARCVERHGSRPRALRAFARRRWWRTSMVTLQSREVGWLGQWERPAAIALRTALLRMTPPAVNDFQHRVWYCDVATR